MKVMRIKEMIWRGSEFFKKILLVSTIKNVQRTIWRICTLNDVQVKRVFCNVGGWNMWDILHNFMYELVSLSVLIKEKFFCITLVQKYSIHLCHYSNMRK